MHPQLSFFAIGPSAWHLTGDDKTRILNVDPAKYSVVTIGDGTCDRNSVIHGLFWTEENAEIFQTALLAVKGKMSDDEWLSKVSADAGERILAHSQRRSNAAGSKGGIHVVESEA